MTQSHPALARSVQAIRYAPRFKMLLRVKLPNSTIATVRAEATEPVSVIRARVAAEVGGGATAAELGRSGRLVLGGRELAPHLTLAQCAGAPGVAA
eukprot:SAG11_NODE_6425_length_1316_cov_4.319638_1_plen_96_part_00